MFSELSSWLFDSSGLTPHGFCLLWQPGLLWLHALSDVGIGLSYFVIPFVLVAVVRRRPDIGFRPLFGLFAAFIVLCGTGHWLDLLTLWVPAYGVEGTVKAMTAMVSVVTAITLWKLMPQALAWPSPAQLSEVNAKLLLIEQAESRMAYVAEAAINARDELSRELLRTQMADQRVIESEERLRVILQSSVVEALYLLDPGGNIETWNACAERIKGYTSTEIIGRNFSTFFTPEEIASDEPGRMLAIARSSGRFTTEGVRVRKDGTRFLARVSIDAIEKHDGTLRGFVKVTTDISSQRIEDEQRAILIEAAPNGTMIVDETGRITLVNTRAEMIFGYPHGGLAGQPVENLVPDSIRPEHVAMRSRFTSGQNVRAMATGREFTGRKWDGSAVAIEIFLNPIKTPRGRIVVASLFDVSERKRLATASRDAEMRERLEVEAANASLAAAKQLTEMRARLEIEATNANLDRLSRQLSKARDRAEQAIRAKSRFLAGMSHELLTPLNGVMGYANLLHIEGGLNPVQKARVDAILDFGKHLREMIACVFDLSEIEAEHVTLQAVEVDPKAIVAACLDLVRPAAEAKGLALTLAVAQDMPDTMTVDPTRLRQVLMSLLGNAVKFTGQGGVKVRLLKLAAGCMRFQVEDTGPGIPADQHLRLFNDFERLDTEAAGNVKGADDVEAAGNVKGVGLGLAISRRLATLMGGRLGHSHNPTGGSVFWLELPLNTIATSPETAPAAEAPDAPRAHSTRPLKVLVVDDLPMNREIASAFLRAGGHQVTCAEGGAEAVSVAASTDFDVVLMDVRMPEIDGLEATRRIRAFEGARGRVPIVALTAQAVADQIKACREAGMDSHLGKPYDPPTLLAAVAQAVDAGLRQQAKLDPASASAGYSKPVMGSELPILDLTALDRTSAFLTPETVATYLETIVSMGETLLLGLRMPDALTSNDSAIFETAHKLAGSAGMFGFERVAGLARRFERAVETGTADASVLADGLCAAIQATRERINALTDHTAKGDENALLAV